MIDAIGGFTRYRHIFKVIFMMIYTMGGCARNRPSCGYWELCRMYYTVKVCRITSNIAYLSSCIKPAGSYILYSQYTCSRSSGQNRGVVETISTNTRSLSLDFRTHVTYIY